MLTVLAVFLINNYLAVTQDWPGIAPVFQPGKAGALAWIQATAYIAGFAAVVIYVQSTRSQTLRADSTMISDANAFLIRAFFWAVLLIGLADMVVSFLRVEGLLAGVVGEDLTKKLGRQQFRGSYLHLPLLGVALVQRQQCLGTGAVRGWLVGPGLAKGTLCAGKKRRLTHYG